MRTEIKGEHFLSDEGNPMGGTTYGNGFAIGWQNGPLGRGESRRKPNGAFVEDIIAAAIDRIEFYESTKFACPANDAARVHLIKALGILNERTREREERGVEGLNVE